MMKRSARLLWLPLLWLPLNCFLLSGCHDGPRVRADPPEQSATPEAPATPDAPAAPEDSVTPAPEPPPVVGPAAPPAGLPDDSTCAERRLASLDPNGRGDPDGDAITEHLDGDGCVAVRFVQTVRGRTKRVETEVPGDPRWFPQPAAYVDLTPRPRIDVWTVDAQGRLVERLEDEGGDGTIERRERQTWEGDHLVARTVEGAWPEAQRWAFDAEGREIRVESETPDALRVTAREFSGAHPRVEQMWVDGVLAAAREWTWDGDQPLRDRWTTADRVEETTYEYDPDGRLARRVWTRTDHGRFQIVETHDFATNGAGEIVEHYRRDDGADGTLQAQRWTTRDSLGRERLVEIDSDGDGQVEWTREQRWDAAGRLVWWQNREGGQERLFQTSRYAGDELIERQQRPAPGGQPGTWIERWARSPAEVVHTVSIDDDVLLVETTSLVDDRPVTVTVDRLGDGVIDELTENDYDDAGRLVRSATERRDAPATWRTVAYDHTGEISDEQVDLDGDDQPDFRHQVVRDRAGQEVFVLDSGGPDGGAFRRVIAYGVR